MNHQIEQDGFTIIPGVLPADERSQIIAELGPVSGAGRRGILSIPLVAELARSSQLIELVRPHLPSAPLPVRAIYFDKSADANWLVPWHQDLTLALRSRVEIPGFRPWSIKDGIPHVQPPVELLERMVTVRLHLDDADDTNGALRVIPGSHCLGRIPTEKIPAIRSGATEVLCSVIAGDALLMRPLILHSSGRSESPRHRRVLHIEYAGFQLPPSLAWHEGG